MRCERFCYFFAVVFTTALSCFADSLERFSPDFSTNTTITWRAPTNNLPKSLWTYQKKLPHIFSATVISNAVVMASLTNKGFPKPSTNDFFVWEDEPANWPGIIPEVFGITPKDATVFYQLSHFETYTNTANIPADEIILKRARAYAVQLSIDPAQVALKDWTSSYKKDENDNDLTNQLIGRGVYFVRQLDGIKFMGNGNDGYFVEGFYIEFGSNEQIRTFSMVWPEFKPDKKSQIASPQQIIACIKAHKVIVFPEGENYFDRVKNLANTKTFTITKITPYYGEGVLGDTNDDFPPKIVTPLAELEAVADFGNSNATVRLLSPIVSSEVNRLLSNH